MRPAPKREAANTRHTVTLAAHIVGRMHAYAGLLVILLLCVAGCTPLHVAGPPSEALPEKPTFTQSGIASWYGKAHQGALTADGEHYDMKAMTAAHRTLPFGTIARVTRVDTGRVVKVRINDRGPNVEDRIIDLSSAAGSALGMREEGVLAVRVDVFASDQGP
jgi:peptidoglycan lytic transglycosylase